MKKIEIDILKSASERDGNIAADVARPLLKKYSDSRIRSVMQSLAVDGYLSLDRRTVPQRVFVTITDEGRRMITNGPM